MKVRALCRQVTLQEHQKAHFLLEPVDCIYCYCFVVSDTITENGEILVYFDKESLNGFKPPDEWTHAVQKTHREKQQESQG